MRSPTPTMALVLTALACANAPADGVPKDGPGSGLDLDAVIGAPCTEGRFRAAYTLEQDSPNLPQTTGTLTPLYGIEQNIEVCFAPTGDEEPQPLGWYSGIAEATLDLDPATESALPDEALVSLTATSPGVATYSVIYDETDDTAFLTFAFEAAVSPTRWVLSFACGGLEGDWLSATGELQLTDATCLSGGTQVLRNTPTEGITDAADGPAELLFEP